MLVAEKVTTIIVEMLGCGAEEVKSDALFIDDLGCDSLDAVELIMAFEDAFDIEINDADAEKIRTVQDAIDYINSRVPAVPRGQN